MKYRFAGLGVILEGDTLEEIKTYADDIVSILRYIESERADSDKEAEMGNHYGSDYIWEERMPKVAADWLLGYVLKGKIRFLNSCAINWRVLNEVEWMLAGAEREG